MLVVIIVCTSDFDLSGTYSRCHRVNFRRTSASLLFGPGQQHCNCFCLPEWSPSAPFWPVGQVPPIGWWKVACPHPFVNGGVRNAEKRLQLRNSQSPWFIQRNLWRNSCTHMIPTRRALAFFLDFHGHFFSPAAFRAKKGLRWIANNPSLVQRFERPSCYPPFVERARKIALAASRRNSSQAIFLNGTTLVFSE